MKRIFKFLVIVMAIGALIQTVALAKNKGNETNSGRKSDGPGI